MENVTIKQQLERMQIGDSLVIDASRPTIFVNAKRAKITVTTKAKGKQIEVTKTGDLTVIPKLPKVQKRKPLIDQLKELSCESRLKLFEQFELCCAMNRGECICETEPLETPQIVQPMDSQPSRLEMARMALMSVETKVQAPVAEMPNEWIDIGEHWNEIQGEMVAMQEHYKTGRHREKPSD